MARQRTPEGPPPAPVVQKLRIQYAKRGRLRFSSSRDFQRALERALRRAQVPVAFSAGFHPHPKISYANAAPTGVASEAEYVEISLAQERDPDQVGAALDAALPPGLDVVRTVTAPPGALADLLQASAWRIEFAGVDADAVRAAFDALLALPRAEVTRMTKSGPRTFDVRAALRSVRVSEHPALGGGPGALAELLLDHVTPAVRPGDVLTALHEQAGLDTPRPPLVTRLAQGRLDAGGALDDPLDHAAS